MCISLALTQKESGCQIKPLCIHGRANPEEATVFDGILPQRCLAPVRVLWSQILSSCKWVWNSQWGSNNQYETYFITLSTCFIFCEE